MIRDEKLDPDEATALLEPMASKYGETVAGTRAARTAEKSQRPIKP